MTEIDRWAEFHPWKRHGLILLASGSYFIVFGFNLFLSGDELERREEIIVSALRIMPTRGWAWLFIFLGAVIIIVSRFKCFRPSWGYMILVGHGSAWTAVYFVGYVFDGAPIANLNYGLIWMIFSFKWYLVSGLVNPDNPAEPRAIVKTVRKAKRREMEHGGI